MSNAKFRILNVSQFLAPGTSYSDFLCSFGCSQNKGFFPYDWLDDPAKLENQSLPPIIAFYSELKKINTLEEDYLSFRKLIDEGKGVSEALESLCLTDIPNTAEENYQYLQFVWEHENMDTFKDFLAWYNNLDVVPFVEAAEQMCNFYYQNMDIDVFKEAVSVCLRHITSYSAVPTLITPIEITHHIVTPCIYRGPLFNPTPSFSETLQVTPPFSTATEFCLVLPLFYQRQDGNSF